MKRALLLAAVGLVLGAGSVGAATPANPTRAWSSPRHSSAASRKACRSCSAPA